MTKIVAKIIETKTYEGFWNGKIYGSKLFLNGSREHNGYVIINGQESSKKSVEIETANIISMEPDKQAKAVPGGLPKSVGAWMKEMEKVG